jgi:ABC-2 type transport system ATP-binding protein
MRMIETRQLRRTFESRKADVEAVAGVDLCVESGEIFGFLGPNGAGKTTTLRMLATLLPPTSGEAAVAGCDLRREPDGVRRRIGYVGQAGGTDPAIFNNRLAEPSVAQGVIIMAVLALIASVLAARSFGKSVA